MKTFNLLLITIGFLLIANNDISAQFSFGAGTSLNLESPINVGVQGKVLYGFSETINAAGTFTYYFESPGTMTSIDLDCHYALLSFGDGGQLAPFGGLNILRFGFEGFSTSSTNLNLGAFITLPISKLNIYVEPKLTVGDASSFFLAAGVLF